MKFWDSSAIVPLFVDEPASADIHRLFAQDPSVIVWTMTSVELLSAAGRLGRTTPQLGDLMAGLRQELVDRTRAWETVRDLDGVRRRAERLVGVHALAAADAMQLGAAMAAASDKPETLPFVTLDRGLARAAQLEGFRVLGLGADRQPSIR